MKLRQYIEQFLIGGIGQLVFFALSIRPIFGYWDTNELNNYDLARIGGIECIAVMLCAFILLVGSGYLMYKELLGAAVVFGMIWLLPRESMSPDAVLAIIRAGIVVFITIGSLIYPWNSEEQKTVT